ncbi:MAG: hypothetical protein ACR2PO_07130 [Methyloligellaceae bacterium]
MIRYCVLALLAFALAGCDLGKEDGPYLDFAGGGFIFNYRLSLITYGFTARVLRDLPEGSTLEVAFEDPAGGAAIVVREPARPGRDYYKFETPPVKGVRKDVDYKVELRLIGPAGEAGKPVLGRYTRAFRSQLDADILPAEPLVVGPFYDRPKKGAPQPAAEGKAGR